MKIVSTESQKMKFSIENVLIEKSEDELHYG
jgi:hypothetical protein